MSILPVIEVRSLLNVDRRVLLKKLDGRYNVLFEDDKIVTLSGDEIGVLIYIWNVYSGKYKIKSNYVLNNFYKNGLLNGGTLNKIFEIMKVDIVDTIIEPNESLDYFAEISKLHKDIMNAFNNIHSEYLFDSLKYVTGLDLEDILEIQYDEELMESLTDLKKSASVRKIKKNYDLVDRLLSSEYKYEHNPLAKAYRAGIVNPNQIFQILGARGYVTDMDSSIFKYPITSSFALGMDDLYSIVTESRSAAKALVQSTTAIQTSEEFGRLLQLITMVVENLEKTDCGSTDYYELKVQPSSDGYKGDLKNLDGKFYLDEDTNKLVRINGTKDEHLIGRTLKFRSPLKCKLKNQHSICTTCFGGLSMNIPAHPNLGYLVAAIFNALLSQSILSTKHLTMSAAVANVLYPMGTKEFFSVNDTKIIFNNDLFSKPKKYKMVFKSHQVSGLKDLTVENINKVDPNRITAIDTFTIMEIPEPDAKPIYHTVTIKDGKRLAVMDIKLLRYILKNGYDVDSEGYHTIDISKWTYKTAMFNLPNVEFDFKSLANEIGNSLKTIRTGRNGLNGETPESMTTKIFTTVNRKLSVNLAIVETIIYAFMTKDKANNDYGMGRNVENAQLAGINEIRDGRSVAPGYEMGSLGQRLTSNQIFGAKSKPDHPFDVLITPDPVIRKYYPGFLKEVSKKKKSRVVV